MSAAVAPVLDYPQPAVPRRRHLQLVPAPAEAPLGSADEPIVRLTVRGRRVLLALVAAALLLGAMAMTAVASGPDARDPVTVRPGQTLSDIARAQLPELSVPTAVAHLQMANDLNSMHVSTGQQLVIPSP